MVAHPESRGNLREKIHKSVRIRVGRGKEEMQRDFQEELCRQLGTEELDLSLAKDLEKELEEIKWIGGGVDKQAALYEVVRRYTSADSLVKAAIQIIGLGLSQQQINQVIPGLFPAKPMRARNTPHRIVWPAGAVPWKTEWSGTRFKRRQYGFSTGCWYECPIEDPDIYIDWLDDEEIASLTCSRVWVNRSQGGWFPEKTLPVAVLMNESEAYRFWDMVSSDGEYDAIRVRNLVGYNFGQDNDWILSELVPHKGVVEHVSPSKLTAWGFTGDNERFHIQNPRGLDVAKGDVVTVVKYASGLWGLLDV